MSQGRLQINGTHLHEEMPHRPVFLVFFGGAFFLVVGTFFVAAEGFFLAFLGAFFGRVVHVLFVRKSLFMAVSCAS